MVTFNRLWANHPTNQGEQYPCETLGVPNFEDQCAMRMGVSLRRSGVFVGEITGVKICSDVKATGHSEEEMHFVYARELANGLRQANIRGIGPAYSLTRPAGFADELGGRKGIVFFKGYWRRTTDTTELTGDHIDLWDGSRTSIAKMFPWFGWLGSYDKSSEIWFWEVK